MRENPNMSITPKVPIRDIGTAMAGMRVALQLCRERNTTNITRKRASKRVLYTSWMDWEMYSVMSKGII